MLPAIDVTFFAQVLPTFLCLFSLFNSISLLVTYKKFMRMRMKSGKLALLINICELAMTFLWLISLYYHSSESPELSTFTISAGFCYVFGMLEIFFYVSYLFLHLCLVHNLVKTLKEEHLNPSDSFKRYVTISGLAAAGFTLLTTFTSGIATTVFGFCGATKKSPVQFLSFAFVFVINPYLLHKLWKTYTRERRDLEQREDEVNTYAREIRRSFLSMNIGFSLIFIVVWYPFHMFNILFFFNADKGSSDAFFGFSAVSFYLVCLTSFFMMLIRMRDPILKKMMSRCFQRRDEFDILLSGERVTSSLLSDDMDELHRESLGEHNPLHSMVVSQQTMGKSSDERTTKRETFAESTLSRRSEKNSKQSANLVKPPSLKEYRFLLHCLEQILKSEVSGSELPDNPDQIPWNKYFYTQLSSLQLSSPEDENIRMSGQAVNCFIHARNVFEHLANYFDLSYQKIAESLRLDRNENNIEEKYELFAQKKTGFFKHAHFLSSDKKIHFQIIEKEQKFNIVEDYLQLYHSFVTSESGNLLPQLLGLYTIDDTENKFIVLLLKNRYENYMSDSEPRVLVKQKIVIDADYIRIEALNEDGTVQLRTKTKVDTENISKLANMQKVLPLAPADRTRLLEILRKNLKFLDKAEIVGYKVIFMMSTCFKQEPFNLNKQQALSDGDFLKQLKTIEGDKIDVFIELRTYTKASKAKTNEVTLKSFSSDAPRIYRQCVDETLYQFL